METTTTTARGVWGMDSPQIRDVPTAELDRALMRAVYRAHMDHARRVSEGDMLHIVDSLALAALFECPGIRIGEAEVAIAHGSLGGYGEVFALSVATFIRFLRARMADPSRAADLAREARPPAALLPERAAPTGAEVLEADKRLLARAYGIWKRTGRYEDYGNYLYRVAAKKLRLFSLSEERQRAYLEEGKGRAEAWFRGLAARRPMERRAMERRIAEARGLEKGTEGRALAWKGALRAALEGWFAELDESGTDIEGLLWPGGRGT